MPKGSGLQMGLEVGESVKAESSTSGFLNQARPSIPLLRGGGHAPFSIQVAETYAMLGHERTNTMYSTKSLFCIIELINLFPQADNT